MKKSLRCVTLSDFNLSNFNGLLENDAGDPPVQVVATPFGQVQQYLLDSAADCWANEPDCAFVWTQPETVIPAFGRLREYESVDLLDIREEVERYAQKLIGLKQHTSLVLVPSWTLPPADRGLGPLEMRPGLGMAGTVAQMNLWLTESLQEEPGYFVLDASRWVASAGRSAYSPKMWAMAKVPFSAPVFAAAVRDTKAALRSVGGRMRKLLILDLDNTLWGGVLGDEGWQNVRLGGHDPTGEAYLAFQRKLKSLTNRGILLGIASKNTEEVVLEAFEKHPEMVLRLDDFAGWRINWSDKAANVAELVRELNLGLDAAVFLDDNPFEQARVREALPDVYVPEWPEDPFRYAEELGALTCFDAADLTVEDRDRAAMYAAQRKRTSLQEEVQSLDEWLDTLAMEVEVESLGRANQKRVAQLLNKTNQMNLRTRRMTEAELVDWASRDGRLVKAFRVSDRFGDSGLTGILSLERNGEEVRVADFVLSCRVMGRKVEETMVAVAVEESRKLGGAVLRADFEPTAKNAPCRAFWERSGLESSGDPPVFRWDLDRSYPVPGHIRLGG